jgi:hypothetical protein
VDGMLRTFNDETLGAHRKSLEHRRGMEAHSNVVAAYGRTPLSPSTELFLLSTRDVCVIRQRPFSLGTIGCDAQSNDKDVSEWQAVIQMFDQDANFQIVRFASTGSDLLQDTPRLVRMLRTTEPTFHEGWAAFQNSFAASEMYGSNGCKYPVVVKDLQELQTAHITHHLSHVIYEHRVWYDLSLNTPDKFVAIRKWCSTNGVAMVCDEILTFLTCDCPFPFSYQKALQGDNKHLRPDFVLVGKYCGLSALLMCDQALGLLTPTGDMTPRHLQTNYLRSVRHSRTTYSDGMALLRSRRLLEYVQKEKVLEVGGKLTDDLPGLFRQAGLPVPKDGGGFLWRYEESQLKDIDSFELGLQLDAGNRVRLFLDTSVTRLTQAILKWATKVDLEVLSIVGRRTNSTGGVEFEVEWSGFTEHTWEPEESLHNCRELVSAYIESCSK